MLKPTDEGKINSAVILASSGQTHPSIVMQVFWQSRSWQTYREGHTQEMACTLKEKHGIRENHIFRGMI